MAMSSEDRAEQRREIAAQKLAAMEVATAAAAVQATADRAAAGLAAAIAVSDSAATDSAAAELAAANLVLLASYRTDTVQKFVSMMSLPQIIAWGDPSAGGSRSQERAAANAAIKFDTLGGQIELDRLRAAILADPVMTAELQRIIDAGNQGDFFSKIGDAFVSAVPTALQVAAVVAGVDLVMGGALIASGSASVITTPGAVSTASTAALETGVTSAMEAASAASAVASPGVASAATAIAEMDAASWTTLASSIAPDTASGVIADILQNAPLPKTSSPVPQMPAPQTPIMDNVISSATDTAKLVGSNIVNAEIMKAVTPDTAARVTPRSVVMNTETATGGLGIIAGALAVAGLLVFMAV